MAQDKFQAVVVGGGPAGLAAAMTLASGGADDVVLLERGSLSGSKNVMGGILFTPSLERIIPRIWETDAPLERPVTRRTFSILSGNSSADFSFRCGDFAEPPYNHSFTILRGPFDSWLASRAEEAGVAVLNGVVAEGLFRDGSGKVTGVRTKVEEVIDPDEGIIMADVVILAEGANALIAEREGLRPKMLAQDMAVAAKEVIALPPEKIEDRFSLQANEGEGREYYGESVQGMFGSGFVYTNRETVSVGIAVSIRDLSRKGITPNDLLEYFKGLPSVRPLLEGGEIKEYSAHMIPEGGYHRISRLYADGLLLAGDGAGLVNVSPYHEGANLAIASGIMAGETALEALDKGDSGEEVLSAYQRRLEESFVLKDMEKYAGLPGFLKENPQLFSAWPGTFISMLKDIFEISEIPKQALEDRALDRIKNEIGLLPLLLTLYGFKGATRSLYHDATEKIMDYVQRNW